MTAKTRKKRGGREEAIAAWAAQAPNRAAAARDNRRIDDAEHQLEYGHLSPGVDEHLQAVQDRYERTVLGWGCD